jgi:transcriptional regulator with XRE-family HTH domain
MAKIRNEVSRKTLPPDILTLGQAVHWARMLQGMTLTAFAEKLGVSTGFASDLERGKRRTNRMDLLAEILGVEVGDLHRVDRRWPSELKEWILDHPKVVSFLSELKAGGGDAKLRRELGLRPSSLPALP